MAIDPVLGSIGAAALALFGWLARWAWIHTHQRIDETRKMIIERDVEDRKRHDDVLRCTTRLETQMGRFISDVESEKRTRADVNKEIFAELRRIAERLPERRDGREDRER